VSEFGLTLQEMQVCCSRNITPDAYFKAKPLQMAVRQGVYVWPPQAKQMFLTGFLSAKLFLKLYQAEGFLLHRLAQFKQIIP